MARYYEAVAELAVETAVAAHEMPLPVQIEAGGSFFDQAARLIFRIDPEGNLEQVADMDARLRAASALRRALRQAVKAARLLTAKAMVSGVEQAARVQ